ncbi:unnamed protein product [Adineta ricciae]|uniref:Transposase n=1 Tax=Adineta ricciae TaxID=249248 RepID=A0A813TP41_ADIRI|nr:unnamed protein product [Adineta ricciae]
MPINLQLRIKIVLTMAKLESLSPVRRYFQRENVSNIPSEKSIKAVYDKFIETGTVFDRQRSGRPSLMTEEKLDEIEEVLSTTSMVSVRGVSQSVNLSKTVVHRAMRDVLGYKPYKMHRTQQLFDEDKDLRVVMAEILLPIIEDENNDGLIFLSDDATFHVSGMIHKHNCRIWSQDNLHTTMEVAMNSPKVTVWCAMSSKMIIGPYFFDESTVNQHNYLDMLQNFFYPFLQKKKLTRRIIFQQDGAPAHFANSVRSWLDDSFDDRWIGRGGSISWAPRSPNLSPLDFFLWGYIRTNIYRTRIKDLNELKARITQEIQSIEKKTFHNVFLEIGNRFNFYISLEGNTFEQYL